MARTWLSIRVDLVGAAVSSTGRGPGESSRRRAAGRAATGFRCRSPRNASLASRPGPRGPAAGIKHLPRRISVVKVCRQPAALRLGRHRVNVYGAHSPSLSRRLGWLRK
jgi:hypothetical protein